MNRVSSASFVVVISVLSVFYSMDLEAGKSAPSTSQLCENFSAGSEAYKQEAEKIIKDLENIPGDDAYLLTSALKQRLRIVEFLECLVNECKSDQKQIKQDTHTKMTVLEICQYLSGVMPHAGEMQDVICSVLKKEFGVNSISELEKMAK